MMLGLPALTDSYSRPYLARPPGLKFCTNTSARPASVLARARSRSFFRSSATDRLFRLMARKYVETPSSVTGGIQERVSSPAGLSTLIKSAPRSASSIVQYGPASTREKSAMSSPDSGPGRPARSGSVMQCPSVWPCYEDGVRITDKCPSAEYGYSL